MKIPPLLWTAIFSAAVVSVAALGGGCGSSNTGSGRGGSAGNATGGQAVAGTSGMAGAAGAAVGGSGGVVGGAGGLGIAGGAAGVGGAAGGRAAAGAGGAAAGTTGTTYVGCRFIGGIDRYVVAKRDGAQNRCFGLVLIAPGQSPVSFLTLPTGIGYEGISIGPASSCPSRVLSPIGPATVGGTVTQVAGGQGGPTALDVHVTVNFTSDAGQPASEELIATSVDVTPACP
jgi:hypothetical protein